MITPRLASKTHKSGDKISSGVLGPSHLLYSRPIGTHSLSCFPLYVLLCFYRMMASSKKSRNENGAVPMRTSVLKLKPLDGANRSSLFTRRTSRMSIQANEYVIDAQNQHSSSVGMGHAGEYVCAKCHIRFEPEAEMIQAGGQLWHRECFVCAQCFQPFEEGIFYEFEKRWYCCHDYNIMFAPSCGKCKEFITGRVIKAMNASWHPDCFKCEVCQASLSETGFIKSANRALCRECDAKEKSSGLGQYVCHKCHSIINDGPLKYKSEVYHPYHFNCSKCNVELNSDAREVQEELLCLRCFDRTKVAICGACRRPIEERIVHALGKTWHVEHFVCAMCEKPFHSNRHYEKGDKAYCEIHYHQLYGNTCFVCNSVIIGEVFSALNKTWCVDHFACSICDKRMKQKTLFYEFDKKPACKKCYKKLPSELRKRLKKESKQTKKKK